MAGTNSERKMLAEGPAIILVEPQLGENIGMVARAMCPVQQWVVDAYLITLGALILLAGSLSDLLGRVAERVEDRPRDALLLHPPFTPGAHAVRVEAGCGMGLVGAIVGSVVGTWLWLNFAGTLFPTAPRPAAFPGR